MKAQLIDGKKLAAETRAEIARGVAALKAEKGVTPGLAVILVGDNPASVSYVTAKEKACREAGMLSREIRMPATVAEDELIAEIAKLNADPEIHGILVQLPLPKGFSEKRVIDAIAPEKDVDGFTPVNVGRMVLGEECFVPATPMGICTRLERYGIETVGTHCVVLGRSNILGTPVANLLSRKGVDCTVTMCHSRTQNLAELTRQADILVVAIGKPEFVTADMVKPGAVVVDVGIHRVPDATKKSGYRIIGDVKHSEVDAKCSWVTPVPGGVGPLTIVSLLQNTMKAYRKGKK